MKAGQAAALVALALLGGAAGGYVAARLARDDARVEARPAAVAPERRTDEEASARLAELAATVRALDARVAGLELRPVEPAREPAAPRGDFVTRAELEALRDQLAVARAARTPTREEELELGERVAEALSDLRREEEVEAFRRYQEKRVAGMEKELADLQQRLGLAPAQVGDLREAMLAQLEREQELQRLWELRVDPAELIERKKEGAELLQRDLERILTPDQLARYRGK